MQALFCFVSGSSFCLLRFKLKTRANPLLVLWLWDVFSLEWQQLLWVFLFCTLSYEPVFIAKGAVLHVVSLRHKPWERQWASCLDRQEPALERLCRSRRYSPWGHQRAGVQWNRMAWNRQNTAYPSVKLTPIQSKIPTPSIPLRLDGVFYAICSCVTKIRFSVFINVDG